MSQQLQLRRDTAANITSATGAQGEVFVDTTNWRIIVNDGVTAGGKSATAKLAEVVTNTRVAVGDANYTVSATDRMVAYSSLTASRIVTLPAANAYPTGTRLLIVDESGACSATLTLSIARAGSDTINGGSSAVLAVAYGYLSFESNGSNAWVVVDEPPGGRTGLVTPSKGGSGVAAAALAFVLSLAGVNANVVADTPVAVPLPLGFTRYRVMRVTALNPSVSLTAAQAAVYTASGGGGTAVAAPQSLAGLTTNAAATAGNAIDLTLALAAATSFVTGTLYFRITTAQGATASLDVAIEIQPYS